MGHGVAEATAGLGLDLLGPDAALTGLCLQELEVQAHLVVEVAILAGPRYGQAEAAEQ
jgi:hypothetical protein